ncbi:hypothetical protein Tco_0919368 [Tanacetum coccineum]
MDFQNELNCFKKMLNLRNLNQDPPVDFYDLNGSNEGDNEINSLTMEPSDTFLMRDEVIITIPAREPNEFKKSSVDDLVPIPRESKVTSVCDDFECDMPATTPLPPTDAREEYFNINSPLGEQVVNFLMENVDVAGLPRHLVKRLFSYLLKNPSLTKGMFEEPLGDDSKPRSYDVTFLNLFFDFNDDYTLCYDSLFFDEEFEDINSLDPPKSAPLNYECLGDPNLVSRSIETSDLVLEELTAEIGLDDSIHTQVDDGYYDSEGDILFLEHLLIEETFSDPTPVVRGNDEGDGDPFLWSSSYAITPSCCILTEGGDVLLLPSSPHIGISYDLEDLRACFQSSNHAVSDHLPVYILGIFNLDHMYKGLKTKQKMVYEVQVAVTRYCSSEVVSTRLSIWQGSYEIQIMTVCQLLYEVWDGSEANNYQSLVIKAVEGTFLEAALYTLLTRNIQTILRS